MSHSPPDDKVADEKANQTIYDTSTPSPSSDEQHQQQRTQSLDNGNSKSIHGTVVLNGVEWDFSDMDDKKLTRKIDWRILPWLSFLYLLSFLDRSAIGNAKLFGLPADLKLVGTQFNVATSVFYFSYALFEVPSNIFLKRISPPIWFSIITVLVGVCMMSQGFTRSYNGIVVARFALGIVEAGLFPGAQYLLSGWYGPSKFGLRSAIFFSAATASGAFGGLLSTGLSYIRAGQYDGPQDGWRWIFIVIGLITSVAGLCSYWFVADFPDRAKWLSEKERAYIIYTLQGSQKHSAAGEVFQWRNVWKAAADPKTWVGMLAYMGVDGPLYAFSVFTPTIVSSLGRWTIVQSNLLTVPIYIWAGIVTICIGFIADRKGHRAVIGLGCITVGMLGYVVLLASDPHKTPGVSYFGIYLAAAGIYPMIPNLCALTGSQIEGSAKRSVVMAMIIGFGNLNGAATSQVYLSKDSPRYYLGHAVILAYLAIGWISLAVYLFMIKRENRIRGAKGTTETFLSSSSKDSSYSDETAHSSALQARSDEIAQLKSSGGLKNRYRAMMLSLGESRGGTYATEAEAKELKGDAYSGFRYSL